MRKQSPIIQWSLFWIIYYISHLSESCYNMFVWLTADGSIRISLIMCERLPQVAIIAVRLCAHGHRRAWRQETGPDGDLLIHQGANRGGCDGGGRAGAAPPPQPACKKPHEDIRTAWALHRRLVQETTKSSVAGQRWKVEQPLLYAKRLFRNRLIRIYLISLKHGEELQKCKSKVGRQRLHVRGKTSICGDWRPFPCSSLNHSHQGGKEFLPRARWKRVRLLCSLTHGTIFLFCWLKLVLAVQPAQAGAQTVKH